MSANTDHQPVLPPEQQRMRDKCYHPTGTFVPFPKEAIEQSIPERFEEVVRLHPDRLAVKDRREALTYAELNKRANQVAHQVLAHRGSSNEPVAMLLSRDVSYIVAMLGILKAGKIYLPIDPTLPSVRIATVLEEAQIGLLVTQNDHVVVAHAVSVEQPVLNLNGMDTTCGMDNPGVPIAPDAMACLVYTSGSTGRPKGCASSHRSVLHNTRWLTNLLHVCPEDRVTFMGTGGRSDILRVLLNGAALFPIDIKRDGFTDLTGWLIHEGVTIYFSAVSVLRQFMHTLTEAYRFPELRIIQTVGEPVYRRDVKLFQQRFSPDCLLVNMYGTSETINDATYFIDQTSHVASSVVPVGYPGDDHEILVLDESGGAVADGQVGEIAIKSPYITTAYWRRPELSVTAFRPPAAGDTAYTYYTGDLGIRRADGCLEHLGRKDFQVKIRGNRVEVAEIEMALLDLEVVKGAVVVAQQDSAGTTRLIGYIVPSRTPPTASMLRRALAEKLPAYMIPAAFVILQSLPYIGMGKVNRRALPEPHYERPDLDVPCIAPRTPIETTLVQIWSEMLHLEQVGIHDPFLDLGGHSLLATQLLARVIETFRVDLPLRMLLEAPTIAEMAVIITQHRAAQADPDTMARLLAEVEALTEVKIKHQT